MAFNVAERREWQEATASNGVWCPIYIDGEDSGSKAKIAPARNKNFQAKYRRLEKIALTRSRKKKFEDLSSEVQQDVFFEACYETVVLDWEGVEEDGKELEFNEKNFLLVMKEVWGFSEEILGYSMTEETFKAEHVEEVEKNS
jgi:hypothetical protein